MPHPCALIEEGMQGFEACKTAELSYAAEKIAGTAPAETVATLKETLIANAPMITERLNSALVKIGEWVEMTSEFAVEQTPLLVKEIVWFGIADAAFVPLMGLMILGVGIWALRKTFTTAERWQAQHAAREEALNEDRPRRSGVDTTLYEVTRWVFPIAGGLLTFVGFLMFACNVFDVVKPWLAPRLYLIEYFRQLAG